MAYLADLLIPSRDRTRSIRSLVVDAQAELIHLDAALKWINLRQDPKVNAGIPNAAFYATANKAARQYVKPAVARDPLVYPADEVPGRMTRLKPMPHEIRRLRNRLWARLKTGRGRHRTVPAAACAAGTPASKAQPAAVEAARASYLVARACSAANAASTNRITSSSDDVHSASAASA